MLTRDRRSEQRRAVPQVRPPGHLVIDSCASPQTVVTLVGASCHLSGPSLLSWEGFLWAQVVARRCRTSKIPRRRGSRNTREEVPVETPSPHAPKGSTIRRSVVKVVKSKLPAAPAMFPFVVPEFVELFPIG